MRFARLSRSSIIKSVTFSSSSRDFLPGFSECETCSGKIHAIVGQLIINASITHDTPLCVRQRRKVKLGRSNYLPRVINYLRDSIPAHDSSLLIPICRLGITTEKKNIQGVRSFFLPLFRWRCRERRSTKTNKMWRVTLGRFGRAESTESPEGESPPPWGSPRPHESALADAIYSLGSPFATLEPLILPVDREILKGKSLLPDCGTHASPHSYGSRAVFVIHLGATRV